MRFGIQLLNTGLSLNSFSTKNLIEINQGETVDLYFQLIDKDQNNLRYIPASGATVYVEFARYPEYFPAPTNVRETKDYSIRRYATTAFSEDTSIWKLSLTSVDTENMMSTNMRVTLTEGTKISICLLQQALKVIPKEG